MSWKSSGNWKIDLERCNWDTPVMCCSIHSGNAVIHEKKSVFAAKCCVALRRCFLWKLWVLQPAVARQPHKEMSISGLMDGIFSAMKLQLFISLILSVILFIPGEVFS